MRAWALYTMLMVSTASLAQDRELQYRRLALADGRAFIVMVVATEPLGVRVALPQGEMLVGFDMLQNMSMSDLQAYEAQPNWNVFLHAPGDGASAAALFETIPGITVTRVGDIGPDMTEAHARAAEACGGDVTCIGDHVPDGAWVVSVLPGEGGLDIIGVVNGSQTRRILRDIGEDNSALWGACHELLGLEVTRPTPRLRAHSTRTQTALVTQHRSPFIPVPGYPAMGRDPARVGSAWAITLPAAAAWVGIVGASSQSPAEHAALGLAGVYAITVATNVVTAPRGAGVAVVPTEGGGASLTVGIRR